MLQDPEECTSGSLLHCKLATSTNIVETIGAASESACRQDDYISSQTHYNFRAVKPACLKENCLMAVNCKPTDRASLMDVSNYGQKKCRRTASCQVRNPEMDGWEIGGLVLEKSCLKYAEGCTGSVSKSSRRVCSWFQNLMFWHAMTSIFQLCVYCEIEPARRISLLIETFATSMETSRRIQFAR
jgi:hypothetical protein